MEQALIELAQALREDPSVSEETRVAAAVLLTAATKARDDFDHMTDVLAASFRH